MSGLFKTLAAALLLGGSAMAIAANDGQIRVNELLNADPQYRETWQGVVKKEERLPEWVMNLSGDADQMNAVEEVPAGLPADKSPTRHASYRFLGEPDQGMQDLLMEQLKKDPKWY